MKTTLLRINRRLESIENAPGWAAAPMLLGALALIVAVVGLFWDVAYHIDHGRDANLLTPAHLMILAGLLGLGAAAVSSIVLATILRAETGWRAGPLRIPHAALPMGLMSGSSLAGFPLDDLWHRTYGIDVTLWSPTHLVMIGGAAFGTFAVALFAAEARGLKPSVRLPLWRRLFLFGAIAIGLSVFELEFDFGVPQWQMLFHPLLVALAAGIALTAARSALGRGGALGTAATFLLMRVLLALIVTGLGHTTPMFPLLAVSALCVEAAFLLERRLGSLAAAGLAGLLIGTLGMAGEWVWTRLVFPFPWQPSMLAGMWMPFLIAIAGALVGTAFGQVAGRKPVSIPGPLVGIGVLAIAALLAMPLPKQSEALTANLAVTPASDWTPGHDRYGRPAFERTVNLQLDLSDPAATRGTEYFRVIAWQGGGRRLVNLRETAPGHFEAQGGIPTGGGWKSIALLGNGNRMMAIPISMPPDPEYGKPGVEAVSATRTFVPSEQLIQSEAHGGAPWVAAAAYAGLLTTVVVWILSLALACRAISGGTERLTPVSHLFRLRLRRKPHLSN